MLLCTFKKGLTPKITVQAYCGKYLVVYVCVRERGGGGGGGGGVGGGGGRGGERDGFVESNPSLFPSDE